MELKNLLHRKPHSNVTDCANPCSKKLLRYVPVIAEQYLVLWSNFSTFVEYLKPIAAQEREVEAARAKERAELEAIRKAEAAKGVNDQRFLLMCNMDIKSLIHCWLPASQANA